MAMNYTKLAFLTSLYIYTFATPGPFNPPSKSSGFIPFPFILDVILSANDYLLLCIFQALPRRLRFLVTLD